MRIRALSPTLIALVAAGWTQLAGATAEERDAHFAAVCSLIDAEVKAPAQRQKADFQAAGYPDTAWFDKFLTWSYADRFRTDDPSKVDALRKEIDVALEKGGEGMPAPVLAAVKAGGSPLLRLVNEVAKTINPNEPPPLVGAANIPKDEKDRRTLLLKNLIAAADKEWKAQSAKVKEFEAGDEQQIWNLDEKDPKWQKMAEKATTLRVEAARSMYFAHIALREVVTRGAEFGIDPAPATAFLQAFFKEHREWLGQWDYNWGDYHPGLKAYCSILLAEAVRQKVAGVGADDIESELYKVLDWDVKPFNAATREQVNEIKLLVWGSLLRWRLELGDDKSWKRGLESWQQFQERLKDLPFKLTSADKASTRVAEVYLLAARIHAARKDVGKASSVLAEVAGARTNAFANNAKNWIAHLNQGSGSSGASEWGASAVAEDPEKALAVAKAFIGQAERTADVKQQRAMYLRAAVMMRNGVLGLTSSAYDEHFVRLAPDVYRLYALSLDRIGMRYHASVVTVEGLKAISARITDKTNPWRTGNDPKKPFTDAGQGVSKLARQAISYLSSVVSMYSGRGSKGLYEDGMTLLKRVSPEDTDKGLEKNIIIIKINDGDYDGAIELATEYQKKNKAVVEDFYWSFEVMCRARRSKYDALEKRLATEPNAKAELDKVAAELTASCEEMRKTLEAKKELTAVEKKALATALTGPIFLKNKRGQYGEVIAALGAEFWKNMPADEGLAASLLRDLCTAVQRQQEDALKDAKAKQDPQTYLGAYQTQRGVYDIFQRVSQRFRDEEAVKTTRLAGRTLAKVFQNISVLGEVLRTNNVAGADKLGPAIEESRKALADLLYPTLGEDSKPELLVAMAGLLWDMDDHARGGALYEIYARKQSDDGDLQAFRRSPKGTLDQTEQVAAQRPELKPEWAKLRDLLEDGPAVDDWRKGAAKREQLKEQPIDYVRATLALREYRKKVDAVKSVVGADAYQKMATALVELEKMVQGLALDLRVKRRLAQFYREAGRSDEARAIYKWLIEYDPDDPDSATALVDNVLQDIRDGKNVPEAQKLKARDISIQMREAGDRDPYIFWTAQIQIFELSANLNDIGSINKSLKMIAASGDISYDLVQPQVRKDARIKGDDKRVRRAKNALARTLAERFLKVYEYNGVEHKPTFRIEEVEAGGKSWTLFIDADAPRALKAHEVENADGDPVVVFRLDDESPIDESPKADKPAPAAPADGAKPADAAKPADGDKPAEGAAP